MATPLLLRGIPLLRLQLETRNLPIRFLAPFWKPSFCTAIKTSNFHDNVTTTTLVTDDNETTTSDTRDLPNYPRWDNPDFRHWKDKESEILNDIEPIILLTKEILHSDRYMDGETLSAEDEKAVVEKLLSYHPHSADKIGSGLDSIMVDRHPQFKYSRCLFVVRTDGGWIDFSYQKCLRAYIRDKYPSYAERFIREHFKRTST
ncbi:hypothetical protein C5167_016918 [Papaver somniferum]|uniref:Uncharacterized protein n=1 Tax=Papaver somniferum TaxID=3469 RepID=A0A4Y7IL81_PAPSO|nr:protein DCL, chloroplastic-like [Papaver somniferum]RZC48491.1 hypothetical protein C5167_016918 [Papaver somniferum]